MDQDSPEKNRIEDIYKEGTTPEEIMAMFLDGFNLTLVGSGGAGVNTVDFVGMQDPRDVKTVAINTDDTVLRDLSVDTQMFIGEELTDGNGTGGDPLAGKQAAESNEPQIMDAIEDANIVVVAAGLGGGTGSGVSPVIADLARRNDKLVVSFAVMPFSAEKERYSKAEKHLEKLSNVSHSMVVFENDKVLLHGDKEPGKGFQLTGEILHKVIKDLRMKYMEEFFTNIGIDPNNLPQTPSSSKEEQISEKEQEEKDKSPVIKAIELIEDGKKSEIDNKEKDNPEGEDIDSYLDPYL